MPLILALIAILIVGLISIGLHCVIKQEIKISKDDVWQGKSTLVVGVPCLVLGILMAVGLVIYVVKMVTLAS